MFGLSIREIALRLRDGRLSVTELCSRCVERARRCKELNAIVTECFDQGLEDAKKVQDKINKGASVGCLGGIPITIKDNYSTAGLRTTCGSKMLENYKPPYTATVVERLQDHGAILLGKTNLDEFAMGSGTTESLFGPTRNVWRYPFHRVKKRQAQNAGGRYSSEDDIVDSDWFVSGGSSGGSGVAVASGSCLAALGSDTGGSVRHPASFCGVVGLKPSYGLCSRHGLISLVNSSDVPGIFTKTVDDTATVLGAMAGHDPMDSTTVTDPFTPFTLPDEIDVKGLHIGIPKEYHAPGLSEDVLMAWSKAADLFENAGAKVSPISLPHTQYSIAVYSVLNTVEVASNMARYDGIEYGHRSSEAGRSTEELYAASRHEGFLETVRGRILTGNYFLLDKNYERYFLHAQRVRRLISQDFQKVFESGVDVIVTPTTISDSPTYAEFCEVDTRTQAERQDIFTQPVNLAGLPAVVVPTVLSNRGLPIGIQLIGKCFQDQDLLTVAKWFEQQVHFPHHIIEDYFVD
ncbi:glutamyl-tRNA(Gln) amidotransferase subunit A, mitochondrial-like [Lytechinus variegatus]|uniref:glutamyl-tRNA(Gln) amidotransferase subunit A, mitochondrial-like n=1 Tax=Lytechinus variegatus TaxID=7654 RepID=UPI001BB18F40|nr:glutamyl-tRNA(Gln) amidotransferase subunit A, mitochondrial-like [Lytechinus variegatus]